MIIKIQQFSKSIEGAWLNNFPWRDVNVKSLPVGIEGVVQAAYFAVTNTIRCAPDRSGDVYFGTLVHELYHAYQRSQMGLIRYLVAKTFSRQKLETPAKAAELAAVAWAGNQRIKALQNRRHK